MNADVPCPVARDPFTGTQIRIGVMGSAATEFDEPIARRCRATERAIAHEGYCLLTGACPGLPHEAVLGAKEVNGHVIGISPAVSLKEHVESFGSPYKEYDTLIYTGLLPILWSHGAGADVLKRIATPMVGGIITFTIMELVVYPAIFFIWRARRFAKELVSENVEMVPVSA